MSNRTPLPPHPEPNRVVEFVRRHPWAVAAVVGVVTITALRPFTRHIPDPPPVYGVLPEATVSSLTEQPVETRSMRGGTWVFGVLCDDCGVRATMTAAMEALAARYDGAGFPVRVVGLEVERDAGRAVPVVKALQQAFQAPEAAQLAESWPRLVLVDPSGRLRGAYGISELGLDEAYHRALHVLRESAAAEHNKVP